MIETSAACLGSRFYHFYCYYHFYSHYHQIQSKISNWPACLSIQGCYHFHFYYQLYLYYEIPFISINDWKFSSWLGHMVLSLPLLLPFFYLIKLPSISIQLAKANICLRYNFCFWISRQICVHIQTQNKGITAWTTVHTHDCMHLCIQKSMALDFPQNARKFQ